MRTAHEQASARLIADGAYFSRPYGEWADPVYNRDAAGRDCCARSRRSSTPTTCSTPASSASESTPKREEPRWHLKIDYRADAHAVQPLLVLQVDPAATASRAGSSPRDAPASTTGTSTPTRAGGRLVTLLSLIDGRSEITDELVDVAFKCTAVRQLRRELQGLPLRHGDPRRRSEFRHYLNEQGAVPAAYPALIAKLRETGNMAGAPQAAAARLGRGPGPEEAGRRRRSQGRRCCSTPAAATRSTRRLRGAVAGGRPGAHQGRPRLRHRRRRGLLRRQGLRHGLPRRLRGGRRGQPREMGGGGRQDRRHPLRHLLLDVQAALSRGGRRDYGIEVLHTTQVADRLIKEASSSSPSRCR